MDQHDSQVILVLLLHTNKYNTIRTVCTFFYSVRSRFVWNIIKIDLWLFKNRKVKRKKGFPSFSVFLPTKVSDSHEGIRHNFCFLCFDTVPHKFKLAIEKKFIHYVSIQYGKINQNEYIFAQLIKSCYTTADLL